MPNEMQGFPSGDAPEENIMKKKRQSYIGCKIIQAEPMSYESWARSQSKWQDGQETMGDGYMVIYDDGYRSWSPKTVFDRCYRPISDKEKSLI